MIYNDEFVWLHFPKCAGTRIEQLFRKYFPNEPGLHLDPVDADNPEVPWHDTIADRETRDPSWKLGNRKIIFPIRRLPDWLQSRYNFEAKRSPHLDHRSELLLEGRFLEESGKENNSEGYIKHYLPAKYLQQVEFLRVEHFSSDFRAIFGKLLDISKIPVRELSRKTNTSKSYLPESIITRLDEAYGKSPYWSKVESLAYPTTENVTFEKNRGFWGKLKDIVS